jgi:16S rRNA (cytidine1402-2'-O)-methyltransferase
MGNFYFVGFLPKKESEIIDILNTLEKIKAVFIFYFPSRDLKKYNNYFVKFFNNCEFLLAREMSKIHEVYIRDKIKNLINFLDHNQKGEMTFLINNSDKTFDESTNIDNEIKLLIGKMKSKDISEYLSMKLNVSKKDIYNKVIKLNE